jgi:hypothetical protein
VRPLLGAALEEPPHRLLAEPASRLRDRASGRRRPASPGQREIELRDDLVDGAIPVQRHPEHEPDDLLRRQAAPAQRGRTCRLQRLLDPRRVDARLHAIEGAFGQLLLGYDPIREVSWQGITIRAIPAS